MAGSRSRHRTNRSATNPFVERAALRAFLPSLRRCDGGAIVLLSYLLKPVGYAQRDSGVDEIARVPGTVPVLLASLKEYNVTRCYPAALAFSGLHVPVTVRNQQDLALLVKVPEGATARREEYGIDHDARDALQHRIGPHLTRKGGPALLRGCVGHAATVDLHSSLPSLIDVPSCRRMPPARSPRPSTTRLEIWSS